MRITDHRTTHPSPSFTTRSARSDLNRLLPLTVALALGLTSCGGGGGGGGGVAPATAVTGADGLGQTVWTLGPAQGANQMTATATGFDALAFTPYPIWSLAR